jgi:hypothetical protein
MGAGKTTVMGEASDLLTARQIRHAAIDLDAISLAVVPEPLARDVHFRNLAAISKNCRAVGIDTFVLAGAIESADDLADLLKALDADAATVVRLVSPAETMAARVRLREPGIRQEEFVERSRTLDRLLTAAAVEDFTLTNDRRSVTEVARELLTRAGWLP